MCVSVENEWTMQGGKVSTKTKTFFNGATLQKLHCIPSICMKLEVDQSENLEEPYG